MVEAGVQQWQTSKQIVSLWLFLLQDKYTKRLRKKSGEPLWGVEEEVRPMVLDLDNETAVFLNTFTHLALKFDSLKGLLLQG